MDYYCETTPLFEIKGVTKYRNTSTGRAVVLNSVFARVDNGNLVTIIGPSGAGKSTLLLLLNRLEDVDEGNIFYQGRDIREWNVLELRQQVGLVFQQPVMLPGNVQDNLLFGPALRGENPIFKPEKIMDMVGLKRDLL
ncbi:MAG: ATP-binding cassette domain-containing protein, partial [Clostridiaceae bacterium]|nr:ATP-binding cassette domain-containing protein [Clostridiaceae bacterium]